MVGRIEQLVYILQCICIAITITGIESVNVVYILNMLI